MVFERSLFVQGYFCCKSQGVKLLILKHSDLGSGQLPYATKGLFLNGKHVKIQARIITRIMQVWEVHCLIICNITASGLLKDMGVNAYRTSHNPPTPELLDACDSLGMLVLDENRLLNSSPEYMDQFERLIKRDRNHPSFFCGQ